MYILLIDYWKEKNDIFQQFDQYEPPKTTSYPFGDEEINADIMEERVEEEPRFFEIDTIKVWILPINITKKNVLNPT